MKKKQSTPPVDVRKVIRAAMEAALDEPPAQVPTKKRRRLLSGRRVVVLGAGAGAYAVARGRGGALVKSVQDRVESLGVDLPGKAPVEPDLDADGLVDDPKGAVDDLVGDGPEASEDEAPKPRKARSGGARQRQPRQQQRGRQRRAST